MIGSHHTTVPPDSQPSRGNGVPTIQFCRLLLPLSGVSRALWVGGLPILYDPNISLFIGNTPGTGPAAQVATVKGMVLFRERFYSGD